MPLTLGQKICSIQNKMGYVEKVSGKKIKIMLLGKASNKHDFSLFYNKDVVLENTPRAYIWDDSVKWSKCDFRQL